MCIRDRVYAARHRQQLDENADLAGLSAANAMAGLSGTFVVNGSPTQTAMVESAGAQSQVAQLATAAIVALVLLFLTRPLEYLPRCVLGALVFMIAIRLIKLRTLQAIRRESPGEFALALTTAVVVVAAGVEQGILLAMILSLLRVVRHSYHPHTGVMVLNEGGTWDLHPVAFGTMTEPGLVTVSYTHLDVYKRQGVGHAHSAGYQRSGCTHLSSARESGYGWAPATDSYPARSRLCTQGPVSR